MPFFFLFSCNIYWVATSSWHSGLAQLRDLGVWFCLLLGAFPVSLLLFSALRFVTSSFFPLPLLFSTFLSSSPTSSFLPLIPRALDTVIPRGSWKSQGCFVSLHFILGGRVICLGIQLVSLRGRRALVANGCFDVCFRSRNT